jgi:hypothetical protein
MELYEKRAQLSTTTQCLLFLQTKYKKASYAKSKVWNVYGDKNDSEKIINYLKSAHNSPDLRQFYSWNEYNSLT